MSWDLLVGELSAARRGSQVNDMEVISLSYCLTNLIHMVD